VRDVAQAAGVSEPTVYAVYGNWSPDRVERWWIETLGQLLLR
jgi:hypothetical protein